MEGEAHRKRQLSPRVHSPFCHAKHTPGGLAGGGLLALNSLDHLACIVARDGAAVDFLAKAHASAGLGLIT